MVAYIPLLFAIVGLLLWALASNAKLGEAGRILFFCGVLALAFSMMGRTVKLF